jgi:hypothetical protein
MAVPEPKKMGRPTKYTKALGEKICERIASGESLNSICRDDGYPHKVTIMRWLLSESDIYTNFRNQYAIARQIQYEFMADDIMDIADDSRNDWMQREDPNNPGFNFNGEAVARSRLRVDSRKWFLSKVLPKFKDKQDETPQQPSAINITFTEATKPE